MEEINEEREEIKKTEETATAETGVAAPGTKPRGRRSEKVGIVTSDKMQKTVVVRVDRLVKHPV
jgi:small subunit ribosomal protein S17